MECSWCNLDTRRKEACPWIIPAARLVCHIPCGLGPTSGKLAFHDAYGGANPECEPAGPQVRAPPRIEITERAYISPPARRQPAHREPDRHAQVVAFGEAEHRHADRAVARGDRGGRHAVVLVAEHDRDRIGHADV